MAEYSVTIAEIPPEGNHPEPDEPTPEARVFAWSGEATDEDDARKLAKAALKTDGLVEFGPALVTVAPIVG